MDPSKFRTIIVKKSGLPFTKYSNNPHVVIDLALSSLLSTAAHPAQQVRRSVVVANTINLALHLRKVYAVDFPLLFSS